MRILCGTSGFSYKQWKGPFYPEKHSDKKLLTYYAERLPTVEINNTFYRMPKAEMLAKWTEQVPDHFRFVIKASQRITHRARLKPDADESVDYLWQVTESLGKHRGPILFQLPPNLKKDLELLQRFCDALPKEMRAAFEFRHATWNDDDVADVLRQANHALCLADANPKKDDEDVTPTIVPTTDWGYLRLRRDGYDDADLQHWAEQIASQPWKEAFVFFKHEDEGAAPNMALQLGKLLQEDQ